jgi:hypothetical protein
MNGAEIDVGNYKTKDSVTDYKRYTKHHFKEISWLSPSWLLIFQNNKKLRVPFYPMIPDYQKSFLFWKIPKHRSLVLLLGPKFRRRRVWRIGGLLLTGELLTGENRITGRSTCLSIPSSTTNLTRTDVGSNPCLCGETPASNCQSFGKAV